MTRLDPEPVLGRPSARTAAAPGLRLVHPGRGCRRRRTRRAALGGPRRGEGRDRRHGGHGRAGRVARGAALPRHHQPGRVPRAPGRGALHLARGAGHLGRHRRRCASAPGRAAQARHLVPRRRRRGGAVPSRGAGDRPARQLLQPGAVRTTHPAVGAGDRRRALARTACPAPTTRPSSTRRSGTSASPGWCCGPTTAGSSARAGRSRSTSPPTASAAPGSRRCGSTRPTTSSGSGSTTTCRPPASSPLWPTSSVRRGSGPDVIRPEAIPSEA